MTVMLLQRSATPQTTHSQKTSDDDAKSPFLFLLDNHEQRINNNNNNNNNNNKDVPIDRISRSIANRYSNNDDEDDGASSTAATASQGITGDQGIAMRYYRLWIYACNVVLLGSALGFAAAMSRTLIFSGDPRRQLIPGVPRAYDPTALYAYLALATQLGLVQLLGCIAARRLSARLLNAYWVLLLALLFGDVVVGVAWVFRFERMRAELRPNLRYRLQTDYSKEPRFTEQWDRLQKDFLCCGVTGPKDFGARWPQSCCAPSTNVSEPCQQLYIRGCEESLMRWLRRTADLLFVLGFCVIAFAKLCFLGILRYEIREMIQKIKLLREAPATPTPFSQPFAQIIPDPANNGGLVRRTTLPANTAAAAAAAAAASGNATLLLQSDDCNTGRHPLLTSALQDGGADSDTNSHCALILEETTPTPTGHNYATREKSNGNNNYEMREFNRRLLLSNGSSPGAGMAAASQNRRT